MKITKRELKNLIKEEVSDMSGIEELLKDLLSKLEKLDILKKTKSVGIEISKSKI